jgi:divalent metal cation (Fe/Co/Zn/Cd) transporter
MRRIATFFEIIMSATLLFSGLYLLYEGTSSKSTSAPAMLIGGAAFVTMSVMLLASAVRSLLWHRRMLRHGVQGHGQLESATSQHHRG